MGVELVVEVVVVVDLRGSKPTWLLRSSPTDVATDERVVLSELLNFHKSSKFCSFKIAPGKRSNLFPSKFNTRKFLQKRIISGRVFSLFFFRDSSSRCCNLPIDGGRAVSSVESKTTLFRFDRYQNYINGIQQ